MILLEPAVGGLTVPEPADGGEMTPLDAGVAGGAAISAGAVSGFFTDARDGCVITWALATPAAAINASASIVFFMASISRGWGWRPVPRCAAAATS